MWSFGGFDGSAGALIVSEGHLSSSQIIVSKVVLVRFLMVLLLF